jgi:hypothetical protein
VDGETYTLVLTKGTHIVSATAASTILDAIDRAERLVSIPLDLFGGVDEARTTTLAVSHVIALTANPTPNASASNLANVTRLRHGSQKAR